MSGSWSCGRARSTVIGIGCDLRGDDAAGPAVVRLLQGSPASAHVELVVAAQPIDAIDHWAGACLAVVVDSVVSGEPPGTIHCFDGASEGMWCEARTHPGTHGLGLAEAMQIGRALGRTPDRLVVIGIEGSEYGHGTPMSAEVAAAVEAAAERIRRALEAPAVAESAARILGGDGRMRQALRSASITREAATGTAAATSGDKRSENVFT